MSVTEAGPGDIPACVALLARFHAAAALPWGYDALNMGVYLRGLVASPDGLCLVLKDEETVGVLAAEIGRPPWGGARLAQERLWWIEPSHRGLGNARAMLEAYERWGASRGAEGLHVTAQVMSGDGLDKLYARAGYAPRERHFLKTL